MTNPIPSQSHAQPFPALAATVPAIDPGPVNGCSRISPHEPAISGIRCSAFDVGCSMFTKPETSLGIDNVIYTQVFAHNSLFIHIDNDCVNKKCIFFIKSNADWSGSKRTHGCSSGHTSALTISRPRPLPNDLFTWLATQSCQQSADNSPSPGGEGRGEGESFAAEARGSGLSNRRGFSRPPTP